MVHCVADVAEGEQFGLDGFDAFVFDAYLTGQGGGVFLHAVGGSLVLALGVAHAGGDLLKAVAGDFGFLGGFDGCCCEVQDLVYDEGSC